MKLVYWIGHTFFRAGGSAFFNLTVVNRDKLVHGGGVMIAANHESFLDPPFIGISFDSSITYLARKTLFKGFFKWLYTQWDAVPVDQERPDMTSLKQIVKRLRSGETVLLFPEGARTLDGKLGPAQPGVGLIAVKSQATIQPVRIFGAREALPRGSGKMKMSQVTVVIGDAFSLSAEELKQYKGKEGYQALSDRIMGEVAKLTIDG